MKILLYSEAQSLFIKSGVGKALSHQIEALKSANVLYTTNPNESYDIAHINTIGFLGERILKKSQKENKPVIYHTHTTFEDFRDSFIFSSTLSHYIKHRAKKLYSRADHLIYPTAYTKKLVRGYKIDTPGDVISNGVDTERFKKDERLARKFVNEYKINKPIILCVGLPFKRKGVFDFCEVANKLQEYEFFWFGAKMTALFPRKIKAIIKNPPENVHFPGYVASEILQGAFSAASLFFFPSYEENEGIVVLEALSMKCPVLLRDIPVYKKWMGDRENCYKGKTNDDFIKKIRFSINDPEKEKILDAGRKTAEQRDLKIIGNQLKSTYQKLINN